MTRGYVDADGHIWSEELITYLEEPWRSLEPVIPRRLLPSGDQFHTHGCAGKEFLSRSDQKNGWRPKN
jgi:hypothetical protein